MGIGADIADVLNELGNTVTVLRTGNTTKLTYDIFDNAINTFVREFQLNASLPYDTEIISGDVLLFEDGRNFLVINKTPDLFEGEAVENLAVLFKSNLPSTARIVFPSEVKDNVTFVVTQGWGDRKAAPVYGSIFKGTRGALINPETATGKDLVFELLCIVPGTYEVQPSDRLIISATEYYRVQDVEKYQYPGVHVLSLVQDDRPVTTP